MTIFIFNRLAPKKIKCPFLPVAALQICALFVEHFGDLLVLRGVFFGMGACFVWGLVYFGFGLVYFGLGLVYFSPWAGLLWPRACLLWPNWCQFGAKSVPNCVCFM